MLGYRMGGIDALRGVAKLYGGLGKPWYLAQPLEHHKFDVQVVAEAMTFRDGDEGDKPYRDPTPLPASLPHVNELGTTSAPLKSAAFFIGAYCKEYNEDFMLCKNENRDPAHCLKEGRRVTRCAMDLISKMRELCGKQFEDHWNCLEKNNQEYYLCRKPERALNKCMFETLGLAKTIPGSPEGEPRIHEKPNPIYKPRQK